MSVAVEKGVSQGVSLSLLLLLLLFSVPIYANVSEGTCVKSALRLIGGECRVKRMLFLGQPVCLMSGNDTTGNASEIQNGVPYRFQLPR